MQNFSGKFSRKPSDQNNRTSNPLSSRQIKGNPKSDSLQEMFFARSEINPENSLLSKPNSRRILWVILVFLVITASSWFCFVGPAAPRLKTYLERSSGRSLPVAIASFTPAVDDGIGFTPTVEKTPEIRLQDDSEPVTPTDSPSPEPSNTPTEIPTETATNTVEPSPTPIPIQNTPTPTSEVAGCVPASEIKLSDVGSNLCVSGRVVRTIDKSGGFLIILIEDPNAFYFVAYDLKYENLEKLQCVYAIGDIRQLGNNPIMVVSYSTPLQYCP